MNDTRPTELFVVGSGRSGTTVTLEVLACLDGICTVPRLAGRVPKVTVPAALLARMSSYPSAWTRPSAEANGMFAESGFDHAFYARSELPGRRDKSTDPHKLRRRLDSIRRFRSSPTIAVKNTMLGVSCPAISEAFPTSVFVHVIRHPVDVVASLVAVDFWPEMRLWWDGRSVARYAEEEGLSSEQVAARHWRIQVSTAAANLGGLPENRQAVVRYETLVTDPVAGLQPLEKLGVSLQDSPRFESSVARLGLKPPRGWTDKHDAARWAVAQESASLVRELGYTL